MSVVVVEERGDGGIARWSKTERKERKRRERESPAFHRLTMNKRMSKPIPIAYADLTHAWLNP
jgi:hypothetical protein